MLKIKHVLLLWSLLMILYGCVGVPEGVNPVTSFEIDRYLGKWYEIVRLDHSFERGLTNISAQYTRMDDGGIKVLNRGYNPQLAEWKQAEGKAYFVGNSSEGRLKVSFFGPFYGGYNVIELDRNNYNYAMVCGPDRSYFWILSRTPKIDRITLDKLVVKAKEMGFDYENFIYVDHN